MLPTCFYLIYATYIFWLCLFFTFSKEFIYFLTIFILIFLILFYFFFIVLLFLRTCLQGFFGKLFFFCLFFFENCWKLNFSAGVIPKGSIKSSLTESTVFPCTTVQPQPFLNAFRILHKSPCKKDLGVSDDFDVGRLTDSFKSWIFIHDRLKFSESPKINSIHYGFECLTSTRFLCLWGAFPRLPAH